MTEIAFHFNARDKTGYLCRLLRKAIGKGARVAVTGDSDLMRQFDLDLWAFSAADFVPHCDESAGAAMVAASPIVLCAVAEGAPHHGVLLNLGPLVAAGFERFERLIEVVGSEDLDRAESRLRWKYYLDRGYDITRHDLVSKEVN